MINFINIFINLILEDNQNSKNKKIDTENNNYNKVNLN